MAFTKAVRLFNSTVSGTLTDISQVKAFNVYREFVQQFTFLLTAMVMF